MAALGTQRDAALSTVFKAPVVIFAKQQNNGSTNMQHSDKKIITGMSISFVLDNKQSHFI
jgi:hypothetical protein